MDQVGVVFIWDSMLAPPFRIELRLELGLQLEAEVEAEVEDIVEITGASFIDEICA